MRLAKVTISEIKGVEYQEFVAGALTIIRGPNGVGKSSILDAVRTVFEGGHDPSLLRQGAKKGEVILTLDDGTTITKEITTKGQKTVVKTADGQVVPAPMTFVNQLAAGFAFDPLAFVHAPHKERADYLSKVMPVVIPAAGIVEMAPRAHRAIVSKQLDGQPAELTIPQVNAIRARIFTERAGSNKSAKMLEGTIDTLRKSMPPNWKPEADAGTLLAESQTKLDAARGLVLDLKHKRDEASRESNAHFQKQLDSLDAEEAAEIEAVRTRFATRRASLNAEHRENHERTYHQFDAEIEQAEDAEEAAVAAHAAVRENVKQFQAQKETARALEQYTADLRSVNAEAEALTAAIAAIDDAKEAALKTCPIPGLSVVDGEVVYLVEGMEDPIPFNQLNTQKQYAIALRIAALGAGELGLMVLDNTEAMDEKNWADFKAACAESGFQVIAARVDNINELDVEAVA